MNESRRVVKQSQSSWPDCAKSRWWTIALASMLVGIALCSCGGSGIGAGTVTRVHGSGNAGVQSGLVPIGVGLSGAPGLRASVYAHGPPTVASFVFDPAGRLWLAAAGLESHTYDGVYVVAKANERARKIISGLDDPLGMDWYDGRLYVASAGRV